MSVDLLEFLDLPGAPQMNRDLVEMARQLPAAPSDAPSVVVAAPCLACGRATKDRCLQCEHAACTAHRKAMTGLCTGCGGGNGSGTETPTAYGTKSHLGIFWID